MYRPRDITDSIATVVIIIVIVLTLAYVLISSFGFQIPNMESASDNIDIPELDPLFEAPFGFDFKNMDPASKIIFGSLFGLMIFLVVTLGWVYWYKYKGRNK